MLPPCLAAVSIDFSTVLVSTACSLVAGVFSAWITGRMTRHNHAHTKRWEQRQQTYARIIEALHQIGTAYDLEYSQERGEALPDEALTRIALREPAFHVIHRAIDLAGWDVSSAVAQELKRYHRFYPDPQIQRSPPQHAVDEAARAWEARAEIIRLANADLKGAKLLP